MQEFCIDVTEEMESKIEVACTTGVLCSSNAYSTELLCCHDIVSHQARTSGFLFFTVCHVISESMCRIEISERERGFAVACAKLIPARFLFGTRHKTYQRQKLQSCFIDAVLHCARRVHSVTIITDFPLCVATWFVLASEAPNVLVVISKL